MEQKFVKFEEALAKLGVNADRLNQLREDGELRAYRDGASWKFRADEIDRMASEGIPEPAPPSDISLVDSNDLVEATPLQSLPDLDELSLADDDEDLSLGGSELELSPDQEDTVTAGTSDPALDIHEGLEESSDPSDSILLSEEALGESAPNAPSTIIGRSKLEDADLQLVTEDDDLELKSSDVQLAPGASNVLSSGVAGSGVLDDLEKESGGTSAFENLEELEIDLAAESSRILSPSDVGEVKAKGDLTGKKKPVEGDSDLTLDDGSLAGEDEGTDPVPENLKSGAKAKKKDTGPTSDLELATDEDDFVLAEAGGSDITLDSGSSGINLVSPSDSGLALDDIPLEMGGSAILESLSMGDKGGSDLALVGSDTRLGGEEPLASLQTDDDFRLTPLGDKDDEGDSSSQVIALDAGLDDLGAGDGGILGEDAFAEEEGVVLAEDFGEATAGQLAAGPGYVAAVRAEGDYSVLNILGLGSCLVLLLFGVILMLDMVRNIWSWDSNLALNDSLLDSLLGMFGLK
jgi:hypothetical protein